MGKKKWPIREKGKILWKGTFEIPWCFFNQKGGYYEQDDRCMGNLLMFFLVAGTGCNTMEGAGEDVEKAGEKVKDAAD
jgi:predicted small secreted protein